MSGSIDPEDPSPQAAAWREIREETTLTPSSLELMRQGKSYVLPDESIGREWTIYPFAFRLKEAGEGGRGEEAIELDWEHNTWAWYDPFEVEDEGNSAFVPRLAESLRRVWSVFPSPSPWCTATERAPEALPAFKRLCCFCKPAIASRRASNPVLTTSPGQLMYSVAYASKHVYLTADSGLKKI